MKELIFTVKDQKSEACFALFTSRKRAQALRDFSQQANNPDSPLSKHAEDYVLYELGEWDKETGTIQAYEIPVAVNRASDFIKGV